MKLKLLESIAPDRFDKFNDTIDKYMPRTGEGETMASQIVTAVNKLIYKWYNDGDVFDNRYGLEGWANDLSSYANWLYKHIPETRPILKRIEEDTEMSYSETLFLLAEKVLTPEFLAIYENEEATDSIYSCKGRFEFIDYGDDEEDDFYDEDEYEDDDMYESLKKKFLAEKAKPSKIRKTLLDMFLEDNKELLDDKKFEELIRIARRDAKYYYKDLEYDLYEFLANNYSIEELFKAKIPANFYNSNQTLRSINIPENIKEIGSYAFFASSLSDINIPNSVKKIGEHAFADCKSLKNITIPGSVQSIGLWMFAGCDNLTDVKLEHGVSEIPTAAFIDCKRLAHVEIPDSLTHISDSAFRNCHDLKSITLPNSIESIGLSAIPEDCHIYYKGTEEQWGSVRNYSEIKSPFKFIENKRDKQID